MFHFEGEKRQLARSLLEIIRMEIYGHNPEGTSHRIRLSEH